MYSYFLKKKCLVYSRRGCHERSRASGKLKDTRGEWGSGNLLARLGVGSDGIADASRHLGLETEPSSGTARFAHNSKRSACSQATVSLECASLYGRLSTHACVLTRSTIPNKKYWTTRSLVIKRKLQQARVYYKHQFPSKQCKFMFNIYPETHEGLKRVTLICLLCPMLVIVHFWKYHIWNEKKR